MKYPHTIDITRTAETISTTGGAPVDGATSTIYCDKCDAQENSKRFDVQSGIIASKGSATVYVPDRIVLDKGITIDDDVTITWKAGSTQAGRIESVDRLEDSFCREVHVIAFTIEIENIEEMIGRFDAYGEAAHESAFAGIERTAIMAQDEARVRAPKETTTLANSIQITERDEAALSVVVQTTQPSREYAAYQEFGYQGAMIVGPHKRTITMAFGRPITPVTVSVIPHTRFYNYAGQGYMRAGAELAERTLTDNVRAELEALEL